MCYTTGRVRVLGSCIIPPTGQPGSFEYPTHMSYLGRVCPETRVQTNRSSSNKIKIKYSQMKLSDTTPGTTVSQKFQDGDRWNKSTTDSAVKSRSCCKDWRLRYTKSYLFTQPQSRPSCTIFCAQLRVPFMALFMLGKCGNYETYMSNQLIFLADCDCCIMPGLTEYKADLDFNKSVLSVLQRHCMAGFMKS